jgi:hypothetical protein
MKSSGKHNLYLKWPDGLVRAVERRARIVDPRDFSRLIFHPSFNQR